MRSASWGVVMEPSTSERSYGPLTTAREASGKLAISTASATASSSSSQSRRLSWHPSQEENFQTASLGLRWGMSDLRLAEQHVNAVVGKDRSVFAGEDGAVLAVAAKTYAAFHVALHGKVGALHGNAALLEFHGGETHHDFRTADKGRGIAWIEGGAGNHVGDYPNVAAPGTGGAIYGDLNFEVELAAPVLQFVAVENVFRGASAVEKNDLAVLLALCHQTVEGGSERREADASGYDDNVTSSGVFDGPVRAERSTNAEHVAASQQAHGLGNGADDASGVLEHGRSGRIAADGDGYLTDAKYIKHIELAGEESVALGGVGGHDFEGKGVVGLLSHALNAIGSGEHRIRIQRLRRR